jgi:hypothetical protein
MREKATVRMRIISTEDKFRKRNNYAIELFKADSPGNIIEDDCFQIEEGETEVKDYGKKEEGDWLIKINDQANEGGWGRSGCSAEFTYYHIYVQVRKDPSKCTLRSPVLGTKRCYEIRPDPNRSDLKGAEKTIKAPLPPCASVFTKEDGCLAVKTGLGIDISTNPADFIQDVYGIILGISGGIALVLIIFSGYQMTTSRGVPEKLEAAREQLVSAIIGLIFIIIALAVIQIIGIDILRIPGFSR